MHYRRRRNAITCALQLPTEADTSSGNGRTHHRINDDGLPLDNVPMNRYVILLQACARVCARVCVLEL